MPQNNRNDFIRNILNHNNGNMPQYIIGDIDNNVFDIGGEQVFNQRFLDDPKKNVDLPSDEEVIYSDTNTVDDDDINENNLEYYNYINNEINNTYDLFLAYAKELCPLVEELPLFNLTKRSAIVKRINTLCARELWALYKQNGNQLPSNFTKRMYLVTELMEKNKKKIVDLSNKYFGEILGGGHEVKRNSNQFIININGIEYVREF